MERSLGASFLPPDTFTSPAGQRQGRRPSSFFSHFCRYAGTISIDYRHTYKQMWLLLMLLTIFTPAAACCGCPTARRWWQAALQYAIWKVVKTTTAYLDGLQRHSALHSHISRFMTFTQRCRWRKWLSSCQPHPNGRGRWCRSAIEQCMCRLHHGAAMAKNKAHWGILRAPLSATALHCCRLLLVHWGS